MTTRRAGSPSQVVHVAHRGDWTARRRLSRPRSAQLARRLQIDCGCDSEELRVLLHTWNENNNPPLEPAIIDAIGGFMAYDNAPLDAFREALCVISNP